jgi:hypothetical protein
MYSQGPHIDVPDLELSPMLVFWSDIWEVLNRIFGSNLQFGA